MFDGVGGDIGLAAFGLLAAGGRFCPFGMASGSFAPVTAELARARQVTIRAGAAASPEELAALTRTALAEAAAGRLRPVIGQEFELAAAAERARGDRGQDDDRQDAADGAAVIARPDARGAGAGRALGVLGLAGGARGSGAGQGRPGRERGPFGPMIMSRCGTVVVSRLTARPVVTDSLLTARVFLGSRCRSERVEALAPVVRDFRDQRTQDEVRCTCESRTRNGSSSDVRPVTEQDLATTMRRPA